MKRTSSTIIQSEFYQPIAEAVEKFPGIQCNPNHINGTEFKVAGKDLGHVHTMGVADILFPKTAINYLIKHKIAKFHLWTPYMAIMFPVKAIDDMEKAIWLFKESYILHVLDLKKEGHMNDIPGNLDLNSFISDLQSEDASMAIILEIFKDEPKLHDEIIEWGYVT